MILADRSPGGTTDADGMSLKELLSYQTMWGLFLVQGCVNYTQYLFLTWLPTYLVQSRGLNILHSGLQTGICYFGAMVLTIGMGRLCDHLLTPEAVAGRQTTLRRGDPGVRRLRHGAGTLHRFRNPAAGRNHLFAGLCAERLRQHLFADQRPAARRQKHRHRGWLDPARRQHLRSRRADRHRIYRCDDR